MSALYLLFANDAQSTLAGTLASTATSLQVATGTGATFPAPGTQEAFFCTLISATNPLQKEIVLVTAVSGDTFTVLRGQEGTAAQNWLQGDNIINLLTAGTMQSVMQFSEATGRMLGLPMLITANQTGITFPAGANSVQYFAIGGGGGVPPVPATAAGQCSATSGGNSGCYIEGFLIANFASVNVTIGAGGTATTGGTGGNTTITDTASNVITAVGGNAGVAIGPAVPPLLSTTPQNTPNLAGIGEYFSTSGVNGGNGMALAATGAGGLGGTGGALPRFGSGGQNGSSGYAYGAGGGGTFNGPSTAAGTGATGYKGAVILIPFS